MPTGAGIVQNPCMYEMHCMHVEYELRRMAIGLSRMHHGNDSQ
jgi:hypothetical protein